VSQLRYDVHEGSGPFLLLVHGMLSSRAQWLPNLPALTAFCRPVVVELFGHGRSPAPEDTSAYVPESYVREFEAIRRAVGAERWYICGQSLGAALTLRYALDYQQTVIAQVFTNSMSALAGADWSARARPVLEAQAKQMRENGRRALDAHPFNPSNARRLPANVRDALVADYKLHDPRGVALTGVHTVLNSSVRDRVGENTVRALMVVGERERQFQSQALYAEKTIPQLEVLRLDAGHAVNAEAAEEFNSAVRGFVGEHKD
jgi:pimeloyl-ACP methyl ester carboxylesterase